MRVLATWNRRPLPAPVSVPANTRLVEWLSYAQTMPRCALVICHAGHGTLVRALASSCRVLAVPHVGDMAENAARVDWAGAGVRLPWPLLAPATLRLATRRALRAAWVWASVRPSWAHGRPAIPGRRGPPTSSRSSPPANANPTGQPELLGLCAGLRSVRYRTFVEARIETPKFRATRVYAN